MQDKTQAIQQLRQLMAQLRDPVLGCPWDQAQTFATIAPFTLEEAYEVADAIAREDFIDLKAELGDLLFQVVFYSQMASEQARFDFDDVAAAMCEKIVRRHPHVFADSEFVSVAQLHADWEARKSAERREKSAAATDAKAEHLHSVLDDVPLALPALARAQKLQKRAASVGFDWPALKPVQEKLQEELDEFAQALAGNDAAAIADELGDVLFTCVNMARHLSLNAEQVLTQANAKFTRRFQALECAVQGDGLRVEDLNTDALEAYWQQIKAGA